MSWQINENYDILKENKTGNIMPDEELIVFWNERIKIISESIARFDKNIMSIFQKIYHVMI